MVNIPELVVPGELLCEHLFAGKPVILPYPATFSEQLACHETGTGGAPGCEFFQRVGIMYGTVVLGNDICPVRRERACAKQSPHLDHALL